MYYILIAKCCSKCIRPQRIVAPQLVDLGNSPKPLEPWNHVLKRLHSIETITGASATPAEMNPAAVKTRRMVSKSQPNLTATTATTILYKQGQTLPSSKESISLLLVPSRSNMSSHPKPAEISRVTLEVTCHVNTVQTA